MGQVQESEELTEDLDMQKAVIRCGTQVGRRYHLAAENTEDAMEIVEILREESLKFGFEINNSNTNLICIYGDCDFLIENEKKANVYRYFQVSGIWSERKWRQQ